VKPDTLRLDGRFAEDYAVDSLDFVRLVMAVEQAAAVKIGDKEAVQARTITALIELARRSPPVEEKR
jgi:acyl carrier protein